MALSVAGLSVGLIGQPVMAADFLPPDQAFQVSVEPMPQRGVLAHFTLAPGVYLYREQFKAKLVGPGGTEVPVTWKLPAGEVKHDPTFDKDVEVYHHDVDATLDWANAPAGEAELTVTYQGCADAGLCYPPQKQHYSLTVDASGHVQALTAAGQAGTGGARRRRST